MIATVPCPSVAHDAADMITAKAMTQAPANRHRHDHAIDGFASLEELGIVLDIPGDVVERLRDRAVFLPD